MHRITPLALVLVAGSAHADPTSGIDSALFRGSYDANGIFSLEGARLLPRHDLSFKVLLDYANTPIQAAVPGIGVNAGDTTKDHILNYVAIVDMAFGLTLTDRVAIGMDFAAYRTAIGAGYGLRGDYAQGGMVTKASTGLLSLRPLSNIDPSGTQSDELAGPLDAHFGLKVALYSDPHFALAAIGSVFLPFGDENMLLGDRNLVFEPRVAAEWRPDKMHATRLVANVAARIRQRTVLEAYDPAPMGASPADAKVILDVGSELVPGIGGIYELSPRAQLAAEVQAFVELPSSLSYGGCHLYSGAACGSVKGDFTTLATAGALVRVTADVTASLMVGTGQGGARGDAFHVGAGIIWAPQPVGTARPGAGDRDGDGIPDGADACPDEPEDKDGFQDEDGCPDPDNDGDGIADSRDKCPNEPEDKDGFQDEDGCPDPDNDGDGILDGADKCPNDPEDKDGFEDEDGCPDLDNDGDGFPDAVDKCPNDPETVNGFEDDDGCPDVRATTGPEERADRIDLKGQPITFGKDGKLTPQARNLLTQVATIIKAKKLTVRVEVHLPLGTKATQAAAITAQKKKDKANAQRRAQAILDYLVTQGVAQSQVQAVGIGSDRPLGSANPTDPINDRVDFIKAQQRSP